MSGRVDNALLPPTRESMTTVGPSNPGLSEFAIIAAEPPAEWPTTRGPVKSIAFTSSTRSFPMSRKVYPHPGFSESPCPLMSIDKTRKSLLSLRAVQSQTWQHNPMPCNIINGCASGSPRCRTWCLIPLAVTKQLLGPGLFILESLRNYVPLV